MLNCVWNIENANVHTNTFIAEKFTNIAFLGLVNSVIMSTLDKVRVLIVGDSETGKTSMSHLIAHGAPCERPMSTIGCSTQVKLHDYRAGKARAYYVLEVFFATRKKSKVAYISIFFVRKI